MHVYYVFVSVAKPIGVDDESGNVNWVQKQDNRQTLISMSSHDYIVYIKFAYIIQDVLQIRLACIK